MVVALGVLAGSASCAGGGCSQRATAVDPLKLVPGDSRMVLQINVTRLRQTQFKDRLLQLKDRSERLKKKWDTMVEKSGLDPMRDIDTVMLALPYQGEQGGGDAAAVVYGRFSQPKVIAWFKEQGGSATKETKYGNYTMYSDSDGTYNVAFLNSTSLVVGSEPYVKKILDLADGKGQSAAQTPALMALVNRARGNQVVWGVVQVPDEARKKAQEAESALKAVSAMLVTVDFAAGLELDFRADCGDDNEAKALTDKFNNLLKELQQSPMFGSMGLGVVLQYLKGNQEGKVFRARGNLPQKDLDDLIKKLEEAFKAKLADVPRIKLPSQDEGGPKLGADQPASNQSTGNPGTEGQGDEPKAQPSEGSGGLPLLKLTPPGATKQKRRPGLLGK